MMTVNLSLNYYHTFETYNCCCRLMSFHKRTDAAFTCVVFEATGLQGYRGPGYHLQVDINGGLDMYH